MANAGRTPGEPESAPIESRRAPTPGAGAVTEDEEIVEEGGQSSVLDVPEMGEFSAEAARPTPLDDLVDVERSKLPKD